MDRRRFLKQTAAGGLALTASSLLPPLARSEPPTSSRVAFVKTRDRAAGVARAIALLEQPSFASRNFFVKPNCNSADTPPGSTHIATLAALLRALRANGAGHLVIGDRSGMGDTRTVMESKGIFALARELGADAIVLDELPADQWRAIQLADCHWQRGFSLPRPALDAGGIVQTCCLKTHRFGGHFTLSLKNSVGLVAKQLPGDSYNYMSELHRSPHQRHMIAEVNAAYAPALVVLDGVEAFTSGGPDVGERVNAEVVLAGVDRVAIDAVGVAILRSFGTTPEVSRGPIFELEQLNRAAQLGVGIGRADRIELVTGDAASAAYAARIRGVLDSATG